jgi:Zn-dependent protease
MDLKSYTENIYIVPILIFSVVIHEMAHAWVALRCGDTTAKDLGRITLNPVPHIDLFGSILIPLFSILATGRVFIAWAKPVPINPLNFRSFKRDDTLVTVAGPLSNLIIAFFCVLFGAVFYYIIRSASPPEGSILFEFLYFMYKMFAAGIVLNISLAVFNMLPVPPLDGSHVLANMLPDEMALRFRQIGFMGIFIIIGLFNFVPAFGRFFFSIIMLIAGPYIKLFDFLTS